MRPAVVAKSAGVLGVAALAAVAVIAIAPLPSQNGAFVVSGLRQPATVEFDRFGAPRIKAQGREDAFAALGYVTARDRLFQMDMLRRKTAGRLAEIFGADLVASDTFSRRMGFERLSALILARLPDAQIAALEAYAAGVNQAMRDAWMWPLEFTLLRYRPESWRTQDSVLVALNLADLAYTEEEERTASVMRAALPQAVVDFLTPESDCYNEALAPHDPKRCASDAIPADDIAALMRDARSRKAAVIRQPPALRGSNGWVVSGRMTRDGRAILANDMHLQLDVPNIWALADLSYGDRRIEGMHLPGLPMIISGTNGRVAWGMTSVEGDFTDLVKLRRDPTAPGRYLDEQGASTPYVERRERIGVRDGAPVDVAIRESKWGPVSEPLLGEDVAVRWSMLDADATNLDLLEMDTASTVDEALSILRSAGTPPLNGLAADSGGAVGWTLMGKIPRRRGFDGLFAEAWSDGKRWDGYLTADETPKRVNPASGFLVNANQRMLSREEFAPALGHEYSGGYRAYAITRALKNARGVDERDMAALQLDTRADPYRYYQQLALRLLDTPDAQRPELKQALLAWDGRAEPESAGLPIIIEFRRLIIDRALAPLLAKCRQLDPAFTFFWMNADVPIERLIDSSRRDLVPPPYLDWRSFLLAALDDAAARASEMSGATPDRLRWGDVSKGAIAHPLSSASPILAWLFDMPRSALAGCAQCVRFHQLDGQKSVGANVRLVVAPGHEADGLIQMAGGQSGQPASRHYADREADWVAGLPQRFRQTTTLGRLDLLPAR